MDSVHKTIVDLVGLASAVIPVLMAIAVVGIVPASIILSKGRK